MAKVEQPLFILPKKRNGKKNNTIASHVDHIITVQGAENEVPAKYKNGLSSPITEHIVNGIIHSTMEGLKSNMKINLPIITDHDEESDSNGDIEPIKMHSGQKSGYQPLSTLTSSREIIDLSPIYENSSDACSSHGDLAESSEIKASCRILNSDNNESSSATPNSLSQTQSENSFEMGNLLTDSLKNSAKRKKRVNIVSEITEAEITDTENTALRVSDSSYSPECSLTDNSSREGYLTMTGTIKRGKKKGQNVDVKLNISREELEIIEAAIVAEEYNKMDISKCTLHKGPHIFLFSLICAPLIMIISAAYTFYIGTLTWYNVFTHITENMTCIKKIVLSPIAILSYPFLIILFTACLGMYAGIIQITFSVTNWSKEVADFEKGFFGWFCSAIGLSECSPYEVVILVDVKDI